MTAKSAIDFCICFLISDFKLEPFGEYVRNNLRCVLIESVLYVEEGPHVNQSVLYWWAFPCYGGKMDYLLRSWAKRSVSYRNVKWTGVTAKTDTALTPLWMHVTRVKNSAQLRGMEIHEIDLAF